MEPVLEVSEVAPFKLFCLLDTEFQQEAMLRLMEFNLWREQRF